MNDWPADPKLDASLRRLVDSELEEARTDGIRPTAVRNAPLTRGRVLTPGRFGLAGATVVTTVVIVAVLALRGTIRTPGGGGDAGQPSASASASAGLASPSEQVPAGSPSLTTSATPATSPTAGPSGAGRWVPIGSGSSATIINMDVRLADGRVLFIGNSAAEIYDPSTGKSMPTGALPVDNANGSATLLADGRVLLAGGMDGTSGVARNVSAAVIFDPTTAKFSPTGSMITARWGHTATLLADGRVLVAGGGILHGGTSDMIASAEIYDPGTGKFSATGSMTVGRDTAAAVRLQDGRVLVSGGGDEGNRAEAAADLYDPTTGKFTPTGSMGAARYGHTATLLNDGRVLIATGNNGTTGETTIEIYDPATGVFSDAGSSGDRGFYSVAPLADGRLLFIGGWDLTHITKTSVPLTACDLYDPATKAISPAAPIGNGQYSAVISLLDGRVLVVGQGWAEVYEP
jgi:hypothetical protein